MVKAVKPHSEAVCERIGDTPKATVSEAEELPRVFPFYGRFPNRMFMLS